MALVYDPDINSVSQADYHKVMIDNLKRSNDPNVSAYDRYIALSSAADNAKKYAEKYGSEQVPPDLRNPELVQSNLRAYGNLTIARAVHAMNAGISNANKVDQMNQASTVISLMARDGIQDEDVSWRPFGGRAHFEERLAAARAATPKNVAAAEVAPANPGLSAFVGEILQKVLPGSMPAGKSAISASAAGVVDVNALVEGILETKTPVAEQEASPDPATPAKSKLWETLQP